MVPSVQRALSFVSLTGLQVDGGWSKLDIPTVVAQINVILRLITSLDAKYAAEGKL
jgi:hypothetical protein